MGVIVSLILFSSFAAGPMWGFYGHKRINRMAVFTLPPEMIGYYKKNIEYITEHAVDPDKRRYATKHEGVRHYVDIDHWVERGEDPFEVVPKHLDDAVIKWGSIDLTLESGEILPLMGKDVSELRGDYIIIKGSSQEIFQKDSVVVPMEEFRKFYKEHFKPLYYEDEWIIEAAPLLSFFNSYGIRNDIQSAQMVDNFSEYGILPYHLVAMYNKLVRAFESKDEGRILRVSAEIGHYIGDAHVPLHTTENYNGQLTNQDGIHGFWESRLPELFADDNYDFWVGKAEYIGNPRDYYWDVIAESHSYVDSVLTIEKSLSITFPQDQQYCYEQRLERTVRVQCTAYATAFHDRLDGMVEKRMTDAVHCIGSTWFSAWVDAGQPTLRRLDEYEITEEERKQLEEEEKMFRAGEIKGRNHSN